MKRGIRWYGGKAYAGDWIASLLPKCDAYVDAYAGGLSVLMARQRAPIETINDVCDRAVNLYRVIREQPEDLVRVVELTPLARAEHRRCMVVADDALEDARRMIVCAYQGRGSGGTVNTGWRYRVRPAGFTWPDCATRAVRRVAERLQGVQIEHADALEVIERHAYPDALIYCDPPYELSLRSRDSDRYRHECDERHHEELVELVLRVDAMVAVSGYGGGVYERLAEAGWACHEREAWTGLGGRRDRRVECLWMNRAATRNAVQTSLFAAHGGGL